jgi:hypothetical protein
MVSIFATSSKLRNSLVTSRKQSLGKLNNRKAANIASNKVIIQQIVNLVAAEANGTKIDKKVENKKHRQLFSQ